MKVKDDLNTVIACTIALVVNTLVAEQIVLTLTSLAVRAPLVIGSLTVLDVSHDFSMATNHTG